MQDEAWEELLAQNIGRVLTPVQPSDLFRDNLRTSLQSASREYAARRASKSARAPAFPQWWLGAAALGLTLATGSVIAWAVRTRMTAPPRLPAPTLSEKIGGIP